MSKPQLRLIKGGKSEGPNYKVEPEEWASMVIFGTILTLAGTIAVRAIKGRL